MEGLLNILREIQGGQNIPGVVRQAAAIPEFLQTLIQGAPGVQFDYEPTGSQNRLVPQKGTGTPVRQFLGTPLKPFGLPQESKEAIKRNVPTLLELPVTALAQGVQTIDAAIQRAKLFNRSYEESPTLQNVFKFTREGKDELQKWGNFFTNKVPTPFDESRYGPLWGPEKPYGSLETNKAKSEYLERHPEMRERLSETDPTRLPYFPNLLYDEYSQIPEEMRRYMFQQATGWQGEPEGEMWPYGGTRGNWPPKPAEDKQSFNIIPEVQAAGLGAETLPSNQDQGFLNRVAQAISGIPQQAEAFWELYGPDIRQLPNFLPTAFRSFEKEYVEPAKEAISSREDLPSLVKELAKMTVSTPTAIGNMVFNRPSMFTTTPEEDALNRKVARQIAKERNIPFDNAWLMCNPAQ